MNECERSVCGECGWSGRHVDGCHEGRRQSRELGQLKAELEKARAQYEATEKASEPDMVAHPPHYTSHPSGVECITVTEHMGFNLGNALKYIWRADEKGNALEDLRKSIWYIEREIQRRERAS